MNNDDLEFKDKAYKKNFNNIDKNNNKNINRTNKKSNRAFFLFFISVILFSSSVFIYDTFYGEKIVKKVILDTINKLKKDSEILNNIVENKKDNQKENFASKSDYMEFSIDTKSVFKSIGKGFIHCTRDGIKYYNNIGKEKWNDTFTISSPLVISEGNYVAVSETMGRNVRVYNQDGKVYELSLEAPIMKIFLNENGYIGVLMNNKDNYIIKIINSTGNIMIERIEATKNVYPISLDISSDNKVFAVSYIDTSDIKVVSKVLFFYIGEFDNIDNIDGMFSGIEKVDEYIAYVHFMENDKLVCISDKSIFSANISGIEIWSYELFNIVERVSFNNKNYVVYACGDSIENKNQYNKGTVVVIDMQGKEISKVELNNDITYLSSYDDGIIIGNYKKFIMINKNGNIMWEHIATQDIEDIIPLDKQNVFYITKNYIQFVNMKNYLPVKLE